MKRIKNINLNIVDINKSYIEIDGIGWRSPSHISIKNIMDSMQLDIPDVSNINNVKLVTFINQDISINSPPSSYPKKDNLELTVDDNFLYVWVKNRWKRVPLSDF
jgi:hypothetical protein